MTSGNESIESYQSRFLKKLEDIIPSNVLLVNELTDILNISMDSAYRRLRGQTSLTFDEIVRLCKHYKVSFDSFIRLESGNVTFNFTLMNAGENSFKEYLQNLKKDMTIINSSKGKQIIYACEDITLFQNFNYPEIAAFKMFYWMKSILNVPSLRIEHFDMTLINNELLELAHDIFKLYCEIPSIEIWTDTTIQSTIKQIAFYWSSGVFKNADDAIMVCESLRKELIYVQNQAEAGTKSLGSDRSFENNNNFTLYFSDIEITNNCVLAKMGESKTVYLGHLSFNAMSSSDAAYCNETEAWLNNLIKRSIPISGVSEKHRYQFFKKAFAEVDGLIEQIKNT
jgi:hypothetical protein